MEVRQIAEQYLPKSFLGTAKSLNAQVDLLQFKAWRLLQAPQPKLERPIFMIGCPRSGTTISVNLFSKHPDVVSKSEAGEIWDPEHYYDRNARHEWTAEDVDEENANRLHAYFEYARRKSGCERLINKHPRSSVRIDFLEKVFPDALYIHVIRDGRAVAHSIASRIGREEWRHPIPFGNFCKPANWESCLREDPIEQAAVQWRDITQYVLMRKEALGERYLEFTYEEMCERPRQVLSNAFTFCGLAANDEVLGNTPEKLQNFNSKYQTDLSAEQIQTMEHVQGPLLERLGYK